MLWLIDLVTVFSTCIVIFLCQNLWLYAKSVPLSQDLMLCQGQILLTIFMYRSVQQHRRVNNSRYVSCFDTSKLRMINNIWRPFLSAEIMNARDFLYLFLYYFKVTISFRIGWRRSYGSGTRCDQSTISSGQLIGPSGNTLDCREGCYGTVGSLFFRCTDFSVNEDWTTGTNSFQYTFKVSHSSRRYYEVR